MIRLIFIYFMLLFSNLCIAQLNVRNSNYIFSNDALIFVENDINLSEFQSRIYLRNESQLLQGSSSSGNSGLGELSVLQNGTVNEYAYNYWCSPVGNIDISDNFNRPSRVNLIDDITGLITSTDALFTNTSNGLSSPLTISTDWLWTFVAGAGYSDWNYVGASGEILPGLGFLMKGTEGSSQNQLYEFRGKANTGDISNSVLNGQYTLIGNPYPSALDAFEIIHDPNNVANITGDLYYWEQAPNASSHVLEDYVGGYATYTISNPGAVESFTPTTFTTYYSNGTPTNFPAGIGTKIAKRYIPIGQGFMVEGTTSGSVTVKNEHRVFYKESGTDSYFFRAQQENYNTVNSITAEETTYNEYGLNIVPDDFKRFRLNIDFNETYTRQLLMNFHHTATSGFDYGLEGKSPNFLSSDAYWVLDGVPYNIQAFSFDEKNLKIPVVVYLNQEQLVTFRMFDIQNFDSNLPIFIHDKVIGVYTNLRALNYTLNLDAGNYNNRFEIVFINQTTLNIDSSEINKLKIFQNKERTKIFIENPKLLKIEEMALFSIDGKLISKKTKLQVSDSYSFPTKNLNSSVYILTLNVNGSKISKKVIVNN